MGFIWPSNSLFGAPVLFIKKKDGSLQLCVDFQWLNAIMRKDKYPLPLVSDLLAAPAKAKFFTKIDLRHAYHLVQISLGDKWKMAFCTCYGSFEWLVMPFRLTNAPSGFQRFLNTIFADLLDVFIIIYLDDILIFSLNKEDHIKHVSKVFCRLRKHNLFANVRKCMLMVRNVFFIWILWSILAISLVWEVCVWIWWRSKSSRIGWNPRKSKMFNHSLALLIFIDAISTITPILWYHLHA